MESAVPYDLDLPIYINLHSSGKIKGRSSAVGLSMNCSWRLVQLMFVDLFGFNWRDSILVDESVVSVCLRVLL